MTSSFKTVLLLFCLFFSFAEALCDQNSLNSNIFSPGIPAGTYEYGIRIYTKQSCNSIPVVSTQGTINASVDLQCHNILLPEDETVRSVVALGKTVLGDSTGKGIKICWVTVWEFPDCQGNPAGTPTSGDGEARWLVVDDALRTFMHRERIVRSSLRTVLPVDWLSKRHPHGALLEQR
jgi:hypothetical protein